MIERRYFGGPIDVHCDTCPAGLETGTKDFSEARVTMREEGWKARRIDDQWLHFCPDCTIPADCSHLVRA